jgi:hypothetical protein
MTTDDIAMHLEIGRVLARYCHAVDHGDLEMAINVYWPEAVDHHGGHWNGNGQEYMRQMIGSFAASTRGQPGRTGCMHHITTTLIDRIGPHDARVQAYFSAYVPHRADEQDRLALILGRYLDHFQQRDDEWRILERTVVNDFTRDNVGDGIYPVGSWQAGGYQPGAFGSTDPGVVFLGHLAP